MSRAKYSNFILKSIGFLFVLFAMSIFIFHQAMANSVAAVSTETAPVYSGPSVDTPVLFLLEESEIIEIVSVENGWAGLYSEFGTSYISMYDITILQATGLVSQDGVLLYQEADINSQIISTTTIGSTLNIIGYYGEFYVVDMNGSSAYVLKYTLIGNLLAYVSEIVPPTVSYISEVNTASVGPLITEETNEKLYLSVIVETGLNLRSYPSTDSEVLAVIPNNHHLEIIALGDQWHHVYFNGITGYVSALYTSLQYGQAVFAKPQPVVQQPDNNDQITKLISYAKQFLGTPYVWGGTNLKSGVDCSGFTYSVYKYLGITLNRVSKEQIKDGRSVSRNELAPGDLVFFTTNGSKNRTISHVGIYIGNGQFIHSSSSTTAGKRGVIITNLSDSYYSQRYVGASRIIN